MKIPSWLVFTVLAVLGLQTVTSLALVLVGAMIVGRSSERWESVTRKVEIERAEISEISARVRSLEQAAQRISEYWEVDSRNMLLRLDRFENKAERKPQHDPSEKLSDQD